MNVCKKNPKSNKLQADIDNDGTIDYGEFIAAMLHCNKIQKEDHLFAAFSYFDKDGSGYITAEELHQACEKFGLGDIPLDEIMNEVDLDNVFLLLLLLLLLLRTNNFSVT